MNQTPNNPRMNFVNPYAGTGTLGCQIAGLTGCCNMAA